MSNPMVNYGKIRQEDQNLVDRNVRDKFKGLTTEEIIAEVKKDRLPFAVAAFSVTGDLNLSSLLRTVHIMGGKEVFVVGRRKIDKRPLVGMHHYMTIHRIEGRNADMMSINPDVARQVFIDHDLIPIIIEQDGIMLPDVDWPTIFDNPPGLPCLTVGNEGRGISKEVLDVLNDLPGALQITVPQRGACRSHNVSIAASIVMGHMVNAMGWW